MNRRRDPGVVDLLDRGFGGLLRLRPGGRDGASARRRRFEGVARRAADPAVLADGRAVFVARCASCHTEDGRGLIGPNLTDHFQIHGHSRLDIFNTVKKGVPGTAMLAWGEQLPPGDVIAVAKLKDVHTGDALTQDKGGVALAPIPIPVGVLSYAVSAKVKNDEDKLFSALGHYRGPEMPPSLRTRQKWMAMKITMTNGSMRTWRTYQRSRVLVLISEPPRSTKRTWFPNTGV